MKNIFLPFIAVTSALLSLTASAKSELQQYVEQCESELRFSARDVKPMNCEDGVNFATNNGVVNDFLVYQQVNSNVDLAVACRWVHARDSGGKGARSIELLIHNRPNGSTCFFSAADILPADTSIFPTTVPTDIVSPTDFPNADSYWLQPKDVDGKVLRSDANAGGGFFTSDSARCVGCHVAGPFIASPRIAKYLAQYGLLNNNHDTVADFTAAKHYHAVGSNKYYDPSSGSNAFKAWDYIIANNVVLQQNECSDGCHSQGENSAIGSLSVPGQNVVLLPSINSDINQIIAARNIMEPSDPYSDYRWINRDTPGGSGDWETLGDLKNEFPRFYCTRPVKVEAHAVGSDNIFSTDNLAQIPDTLEVFNLREGLVCRNADQADGHQCHDYATRYLCDGRWTEWYDRDNGGGTGDWEQRSHFSLPCNSPTAIQAQTKMVIARIPNPTGGTIPIQGYVQFNGPNDRLRYFDTANGLACANDEQVNGESCSNYVVRFICPN
jgi:hypothetical protein